MTFKNWLLAELVDTGEPQKERPDLLATALPKISPKEEPPKNRGKSPTKDYLNKKRL